MAGNMVNTNFSVGSVSPTMVLGPRTTRSGALVQVLTTDAYWGGPNVTASSGILVKAGGDFDPSPFTGAVYMITASGTADVRVAEDF